MCPVTEIWKSKVAENTLRLLDELNVDGVYLDQVSCSLPQPCHDASHGHRLGGGDFWTRGYRELMKPIREDAVKRGAASFFVVQYPVWKTNARFRMPDWALAVGCWVFVQWRIPSHIALRQRATS